MQLQFPPCLLVGTTGKALLATITFTVEYYPEGACPDPFYDPVAQSFYTTGLLGTFTFDKSRMAFNIPAKTLAAGDRKCVRIITPGTTKTGIYPISYEFTLIADAGYPLISTTFGNYIELASNSAVAI